MTARCAHCGGLILPCPHGPGCEFGGWFHDFGANHYCPDGEHCAQPR